MISSNQSTSSSPLSDSYTISYPPPNQQIFTYNFCNSPSSLSSPLSSPQILTHFSPYYPLMDAYSPPHMQPILPLSPSPPTSCFSTNNSTSSAIRYDISLEAPTAASQKLEEPALTYLNKGQYYNINLKDKDRFDGDIVSTVAITFHDESHRVSATDYWKFWLTQQKELEEARAVELDLTKSSGAQIFESKQFDRVSFKWNGKQGASVYIRFNCLSTDFSRIKGVKGIPLRLQIESKQQLQSLSSQMERTYCRIKLFRDKGAERKNKDDAKHIERQLEKLRGKNGEPHPLWLAFSPTSPVTLFTEIVPPDEDISHYQYSSSLLLEDTKAPIQPVTHSPSILLPPPTSIKRNYSHFAQQQRKGSSSTSPTDFAPISAPLGIDPTYIPQRRRRVAKLSVLARLKSSELYRAIYLEHLTVKELTDKIVQRLNIQKPVANVVRKTIKKDSQTPIIISVDDEVIQDMVEEQAINIEMEENQNDPSAINLVLNF